MEQNFIKKLGEKWADFKYAVGRSKLAKKAAGLILAGAMTVPMLLSASACEVILHKNPNGDIVVDPNPSKPNPNPGGDVTTPQPDYSNYSDILKTVLTSDYYNDIIKKAQNWEIGHNVVGSSDSKGGTNLFNAVPYRFLQRENFDINKIKTNQIMIETLAYNISDKQDELYLKMDITEPNQTNPYITQYLLKYEINEKEYNDLTMLNKKEYIQAGFFIQELDNQREPEVVSKFNINEDSYTKMLNRLPTSTKLTDALGSKELDNFTITNCTAENEDYVLDLIVMPTHGSGKSLYESKIATMKFLIYKDALPTYTNNVFALERPLYVYTREVEEVQNITCFDALLGQIRSNNLIK